MNDDDLQERLAAFVPQPATHVVRERARHRSLIAFREGSTVALGARRRGMVGWTLAGGAALGVAAAIFWPREIVPATPGGSSVLAEMEALFPGQLDAIIEQNGSVELKVAAVAGPASDQPVLIEFRRGGSVVRVLSYSGRRVCVDLGEHRACFEALLGNEGSVIVAGEDFIWTVESHGAHAGWEIHAAALEQAS